VTYDDFRRLLTNRTDKQIEVFNYPRRKRKTLPPIAESTDLAIEATNELLISPDGDLESTQVLQSHQHLAPIFSKRHAPYLITSTSTDLTQFVKGFVDHHVQLLVSIPSGKSHRQNASALNTLIAYFRQFVSEGDHAFILRDDPKIYNQSERLAWLDEKDKIVLRIVAAVNRDISPDITNNTGSKTLRAIYKILQNRNRSQKLSISSSASSANS